MNNERSMTRFSVKGPDLSLLIALDIVWGVCWRQFHPAESRSGDACSCLKAGDAWVYTVDKEALEGAVVSPGVDHVDVLAHWALPGIFECDSGPTQGLFFGGPLPWCG